MSHRGLCSYKFRKVSLEPLPARRKFERIQKGPDYAYPPIPGDLRGKQLNPEEILFIIDGVVPKRFPRQVREEIRQDIFVALLAGELELADLGERLNEFISNVYSMFPEKGAPLSLDFVRDPGDGSGRGLYDRIATHSVWEIA